MREIAPEALKRKFQDLNSHWEAGGIDPLTRAFPRRGYFDLLWPLVAQSQVHRAVILMGPRRVGKTILLHQIIQRLIDEGRPSNDVLYLSLDTPLFQGRSLESLLELFASDRPNGLQGAYVLLDEIQYLRNWDVELKVLVDRNPRTRIVASGSAAAALHHGTQESGAGRFTTFLLPPLTFAEYLDFTNLTDQLIESVEDATPPTTPDIERLNQEFIRYINFGGYPEAVFSRDIQQAPERFIRSDIIEKVLLRDLPSLYGIQDIQELQSLCTTLIYQAGNEVTLDALSKSSGVAKNTIKRYLAYLEAAFLIKTVSRVDASGKTFKRENYFKVYLSNPSIYAAIFGLVSADSEEIGSLVENAVFSQYMHSSTLFERIYYARWEGGAGEVDLIHLDDHLRPSEAIEVKWSDRFFERPWDLESLRHFAKRNGLQAVASTTRTQSGTKDLDGGPSIHFIPAAILCYWTGRLVVMGQNHIRPPWTSRAPMKT